MLQLSKKGQAEVIGLVIIVIMITLGMLFLVRFALDENPEKKIFTRKGLAYSSMSAVLKTQVVCDDPSGEQILYVGQHLIEDCAQNSVQFSCSGMDSCDFLAQEIEIMLNETLGEWHKEYLFKSILLGEAEPLIEVSRGNCATARNRDSSGLFPLYVNGRGLIENSLFICE
jgi:hypothetical protein